MLHHQQVKVSSRPGKKLTFKKLSSQMKYPEDFGDYLTISQIPQQGCLWFYLWSSNQIHNSVPYNQISTKPTTIPTSPAELCL